MSELRGPADQRHPQPFLHKHQKRHKGTCPGLDTTPSCLCMPTFPFPPHPCTPTHHHYVVAVCRSEGGHNTRMKQRESQGPAEKSSPISGGPALGEDTKNGLCSHGLRHSQYLRDLPPDLRMCRDSQAINCFSTCIVDLTQDKEL